MTKSKHARDAIAAISSGLREWQETREAFEEAVGDKLGLIVAERRCLAALLDGPRAAGALAQASGLTPAAATSMIDRLERRGFVERRRDSEDRRKVYVAMTKPAEETLARFYGPATDEFEKLLDGFEEAELAAISRFVNATIALQRRQIERIGQTDPI